MKITKKDLIPDDARESLLSDAKWNLYSDNNGVLNNKSISETLTYYKDWLSRPAYLVFNDNDDPSKNYGFLAAKRGNSVYAYHLRKNLKDLVGSLSKQNLKSYLPREKKSKGGNRKMNKQYETNCFFVTLTCDPRRHVDMSDEDYKNDVIKDYDRLPYWKEFPALKNKFLSAMRKRYGVILDLWAIESTDNSYPHYHAFIITKKPIDVNWYEAKDKNGMITSKRYRLNDGDKDKIFSYWKGGKMNDIYGVNPSKKDLVGGVSDYLFKEMFKSHQDISKRSRKNLLTLALTWIMNKRSFSISYDKTVFRLDCPLSITKTQIEELEKKNLTFIGVVSCKPVNGPPPGLIELSRTDNLYTQAKENMDMILEKREETGKLNKKIEINFIKIVKNLKTPITKKRFIFLQKRNKRIMKDDFSKKRWISQKYGVKYKYEEPEEISEEEYRLLKYSELLKYIGAEIKI